MNMNQNMFIPRSKTSMNVSNKDFGQGAAQLALMANLEKKLQEQFEDDELDK